VFSSLTRHMSALLAARVAGREVTRVTLFDDWNPMSKTWFITGSSSGLGRHLTERLLARGDCVAATLRQPTALDDLKARYGDALWVESLDVTDTPAIRRVVAKAFLDLGKIDVVVSNAGYVLLGATEECSDDQIELQLATTLIGSMQTIRAFLPSLRLQQGGSKIIQISSMGGQAAFPLCSAYHAAKWGIEGFIEGLGQEVAPFGIQTTIVAPGTIASKFADNSVHADVMQEYEDTTVGDFRRHVAAAGPAIYRGDPSRIAQVIIDCAEKETAPKRITLGEAGYQTVHAALVQRLADLEAQKDLAYSVDRGLS
jgi:NAD(P)-dependent dehydrogenase (short-subunit alcohol dehydrogenase family)